MNKVNYPFWVVVNKEISDLSLIHISEPTRH